MQRQNRDKNYKTHGHIHNHQGPLGIRLSLIFHLSSQQCSNEEILNFNEGSNWLDGRIYIHNSCMAKGTPSWLLMSRKILCWARSGAGVQVSSGLEVEWRPCGKETARGGAISGQQDSRLRYPGGRQRLEAEGWSPGGPSEQKQSSSSKLAGSASYLHRKSLCHILYQGGDKRSHIFLSNSDSVELYSLPTW